MNIKGNPSTLRKGGTPGNKGGGRPKKEFTQWCKDVLHSQKVQGFIQALAEGEAIEEKIIDTPGHEPQKIMVSAPANARIKAIEFLAGYAHGKPVQQIESSSFDEIISLMRAKYA